MNAFSSRFKSFLLKQRPSWDRYLKTNDDVSLVVEFPCPNPQVERGLLVTTDAEEVTVYFDTGHEHFNSYGSMTEKDDFIEASQFISSLLYDRIVFVSYCVDGREIAGSILSADTQIDTPFTIKEKTDVRVRSWTGKHDRDFELLPSDIPESPPSNRKKLFVKWFDIVKSWFGK